MIGLANVGTVGSVFRPVVATGGTVTNITVASRPWRVHTFNSNGTFSVSNAGSLGLVQYLLVGGGGGGSDGDGGIRFGAGGSSGVQRTGTFKVSATSYTATRGNAGGGGFRNNGANGAASSIFGISAAGGLGAARYGPSGAANADFAGGAYPGGPWSGGGAGAAGAGRVIDARGWGGIAADSNITGSNVKRGGGGGGYTGGNASGDGLGSWVGGLGAVTPGVANRGSGGGGGFEDFGGPGGAAGTTGVVIVRYPLGVS